ncbi:hypothetical protein G6F50_017073 [Rhizopus delemar]|uniref:Uncharacterized protein n=1 Tax=Rhizopus delemar TaxID=936053 RepID=A0A9P7C1A4_9FUNG|nr:hypothetical protein G6F50_017073 [Rhizopus delemar]
MAAARATSSTAGATPACSCSTRAASAATSCRPAHATTTTSSSATTPPAALAGRCNWSTACASTPATAPRSKRRPSATCTPRGAACRR